MSKRAAHKTAENKIEGNLCELPGRLTAHCAGGKLFELCQDLMSPLALAWKEVTPGQKQNTVAVQS